MTDDLLALTGEIVVAHVSHNAVAAADMPELIRTTYAAMAALTVPETPPAPEPKVPVRASIRSDHLVCLEDGRKLKTLTRHLRAAYGLTPDAYRKKWGLPADYPMVAPAYSEKRRALAQAAGLGRRNPIAPVEPPVPVAASEVPAAASPVPVATPEAAAAAPPVRKRLGLVLPKAVTVAEVAIDEDTPAPAQGEEARALLARAIRTRTCVRWTYNRTPMLVAPYILYTDRDALYVDAVAREKNGVPPRELKLGRFKLSGLSDLSATGLPFTLGDAPDAGDARYAGGIVAQAVPTRRLRA